SAAWRKCQACACASNTAIRRRSSQSERNIVVGDRLDRRLVHPATGGAPLHPAAAAAPATAAASEQRDAVGLDFGGVALVAVLVVPLARLQTPLDEDLLALGEVLLQAFGLLAPQH